MTRVTMILAAAAILLAGTNAAAQTPDAKELIEKSLIAYHYGGDDGKSTIHMDIVDANGGTRVREMAMLRLNTGDKGGDQKFFVYFKEPGDVREMTFMVHKHVGSDDDRWIFVPSVKLVRRIASEDKRSSFVGSDFVYEDVSGRGSHLDEHTFEREDTLDGAEVWVVKSVPLDRTEYAHKLTFIDKSNHLPLKEEYYDADGKLFKVFTASDIEDVDGIPTPMTRTMENLESGGHTVIKIEKAEYNLGLEDGDFSERRMRRPPRSWIR